MKSHHLISAVFVVAVLVFAGFATLDRWVARTVLPPLTLATSVTVEDRNGDLLRAYTVDGGRWRLPATTQTVDPKYLRYLIAYEDKRFYSHQGVDIRAALRATLQAIRNGRIISGGSTLTMQVARLLEQGGTGRWGPKIRQIRVALALERKLSKEEILNLYLTLAPFGGNLEGVRAASLSYFGKEPRRLTPAQSALLVALPQSPETRRPDRAAVNALAARNRILVRLAGTNTLPMDEAIAAMREKMPRIRKRFVTLAPHLADQMVSQNPLSGTLRLTLDRDLQIGLEHLATNAVLKEADGVSVALLVMDYKTGEILASVGSAGFLDSKRQGFVDMTRAIRSPGSTLKPLIYGLAFEAGIANPETLIEDRPTVFGTYAPQNFDKQYYGTISIRDALRFSLNVPAVSVLKAVGPAKLLSRMRRAGVNPQLPSSAPPGLAIALGGVGVSLRDLVVLYAGIARGGTPVSPQTLMFRAKTTTLKPIMSPEAAWQVSDILTGVAGPSLARRGGLAYKTGTSYGYRDAWAIGFDGQHVIGVWVGRPDGAAVPGILGAKTAAPLLFDAFSRLKPELTPLSPPPPSTLIVANADLPQPLRRFLGVNTVFGTARSSPEIAFPPDGARIDLGLARSDRQPLVLKVRNGVPPFTWIADGAPVAIATRGRQVEFAPDGPGFLSISVIDANGNSQRATVEIR